MCGLRKENSSYMGECNVIRKLFMRINLLKAKSQDYKISAMAHPLTRVASHHLTPAHWAGTP